jgi:Predicted nucleoside-diphosphate-sugar epimerases
MFVITGATGNTGKVVAERLLKKGQQVRVIGRNAGRLQALADQGAEPFVCNVTDTEALTTAFKGAKAVYAMIPPEVTAANFLAYQNSVSDSLATAIANARVKHAVVLSSIGADKSEKTGPVVGLHLMEKKLNGIAGLNVLHLRAAYFMENTFGQIGTIQAIGKAAGPLRGDRQIPMIATQDIGAAAADALLGLSFTGQQTRELLGERDLSMDEATRVIGTAMGKPDLSYIHLPHEQIRPFLLQMGMSASAADVVLELADALNSGHIRALEQRSDSNTTPTSYETFVKEEFMPRMSPN